MEIFIKILQGSYAYLLVLQILVVTSLMLALIWLIARRTRAAEEQTQRLRPAAEPGGAVAPVSDEETAGLRTRIGELEAENERLKVERTETTDLKEKVKYLESKLLEYEILQEEIGTLTALKLENEHLKQELSHYQAGTTAPAPILAPVPAPAPMPEPVEAAPEIPPVEAAPVAPDISLEESLKSLGELPGSTVVHTPAPAEAPAPPTAEDATAGLEGLLKQIDELTATGPKTS